MKRAVRNSLGSKATVSGPAPGNRIALKLTLLILMGLLLAVLIRLSGKIQPAKQPVSPPGQKTAEQAAPASTDWGEEIALVLADGGIPRQWQSVRCTTEPEGFRIQASVPPDFPVHTAIIKLLDYAGRKSLRVVESYERLKPRRIGIGLATPDGKALQVTFRIKQGLAWFPGRIAVIVDDFGYHLDETVTRFLDMPFPITFAIIPGTEHDRDVAVRAKKAGFGVLIHLPMEPLHGKVEHNGFTILTGMSQAEIDKIIARAVNRLPQAIGVNNHMGSKATADRRTMARLMRALKRHHLIFVDSGTNPNSVAYALARQTGVPALRLTTYLDNPKSSHTLRQKLEQVVRSLPEKKTAVVIGHARPETARLLPAEMAKWASFGVKFVPLQDLLEEK